ncbi:MAG: family permease [Frankiales bacterium]|nr:family permease [Frankiales bacterium]
MTSAIVASGNALDRYFRVSVRGSTLRREVRGGLTTFFTMAYIVVLNPLILSSLPDADGRVLSIPQVAASTALVAGVMTVVMGVFGRYPFALATGLGLNAFVTFSLATEMSWADAMGLVVLEGIVITVLVLTGFRTAVFHAIPAPLKTAITVGIGLFIAFVGLVDAGFARAPGSGPPVQLGATGSLRGWPTVVFVVGVLLTAVLVLRRTRGAIFLGLIATTLFAVLVEAIGDLGTVTAVPGTPRAVTNAGGWALNVPAVPDHVVDLPDLGLLGDFSLLGSLDRVGVVAALLFVFTLMLADFFDTMGTVVGVAAEGGLLDEDGRLPGVERVLLVDSLAAVAGGLASASSATTYVESAAGVGDGARTGLASVVTGLLFGVALFFTPLVSMVPFEAASPALVVVGFLLMAQVRDIDFSDVSIAFPAFLTIVVMPFTYSITNGIGAGFVSYVVLQVVQGNGRRVHPLLWLVAGLFVVYFAIGPVQDLLTG